EEYKRADVVQIGDGAPCGHEWCCERSELADPSPKTPGNKKLQSESKYTAAVRCYVDSGVRRRKRNTERLFTTSGYIEPVITETGNQVETVPLVPIIAGCAAALLVAVLVTVGIICYRKRRANDDQHAQGLQLDLKIIKGDEPSATESAENPACKTLDEDGYLYETTVYRIQDLVTVDDVVEFLRSSGFGQYAAAFRRHKIDGDVVSNLSDAVLAELIPEIGPRVKLQKALQKLKDNSDSAESSKPVHAAWEIPRSSLTLGKVLGKGQFGEVPSAEDRDKQGLMGELEILVTVGRHDNIISLVGACTVEGPLTLVVEYAPNGRLKDWLEDNCPEELDQTDDGIELPMDQLILFGIDIVNGMSHLAAMQCVHRDLAARNVLLGKDLTAKITDFSLSRDIYEETEYVRSTKSQLPVRWMAYESLFYHTYTTQSDVKEAVRSDDRQRAHETVAGWLQTGETCPMSSGDMGVSSLFALRVFLPDICLRDGGNQSLNSELRSFLAKGCEYTAHAEVDEHIYMKEATYDVMRRCWETLPENRPTFPDLKVTLDRIDQDYKRKLRALWALEKDFPVPPGAHWLLGHLVLLANGEREFDKIGLEWAIQYPYAYIFKHGPLEGVLSVNHPDYIKVVLQRPDKKDERIYGLLRPWLGDGLLTTSGAKWFRNRRLLTPGFHFEVLRPYVKLFSDSTNVMLQNWEELGPGSSIDVFQHVSLMTLDSMLKCALSQNTGCQKRNTFSSYISVVHELSALVMTRARSLVFSMSDFLYNNSPAGKRYKRACKDVHQFSEDIIQQRKRALDGLSTTETARRQKYLDFLDILLMAKDEDGDGLTDAEIRDEVDTFMFEGHDTTASGLSWTLYCLARHPGHQEKCRKEAQEVLQGRTEVTWEHLPSMKYITMCIKESLRLYPPVPKILRELEATLTLSNGKTGRQFSLVYSGYTLILAFGKDPRNCIGQHFAMNELKTSVALILQRFSLTPDDTLPDPLSVHKIVLRADSPGLFLKINPIS
ncbi:hypothetical protein Bbelb_129640, partial [Branchiostoma belcheri]